MFEIIFLGTSASAPSIRRNLPALMVKQNEHRFLIDCGEGTQRQILQAGLGFKRLNRILLTHGHLDHILGLAGLLSTILRWETMEELVIYGGKGALNRVHDLIYGVVLRGDHIPLNLALVPVEEGVFIEENDFTVSAIPVHHRGPDNYGYLFQEKGRRPFLPEKAELLGLPPGPWRKELVKGESVHLPDGRTIYPDQVLGEYKAGTRLVVLGDVGDTNNLITYCNQADALIVEATYLESEADMATQFAHLTAKKAAELAKSAGVQQLILTHLSRRYREKDILDEAQTVFENTSVARDFDTFNIRKEDQ
ncbi:MAG: ribonuclease [Chloroflexi bacterium HGW-Chloroflexi-8]|nr:MAG: ribonuclease [Chloroflexi bacterium HGW-Chloroflexi-8]